MPATINGTTGFGGNLTGNVTGNVTGTASAIADGAVSAAKLDGAQTGSAPIYGCRAWVNFDGTTVTNVGGENRCTIRGSGNVSKVVRNDTGDYSVTFSTPMPSANYSCVVSGSSITGVSNMGYAGIVATQAPTSSIVRFITTQQSGALTNLPYVQVAVFG